MKSDIIKKLLSGRLPVDFNWNTDSHPDVPAVVSIPADPSPQQIQNISLVSEDLRDGLHGIKKYPSDEGMLRYILLLHELGVRNFTVGIYPGPDNKIDKSIKSILSSLHKQLPNVVPIVLTMASQEGIDWLVTCKQLNPKLQAIIFMGTAPSRLLVEEWEKSYVLERLAWATSEATVQHKIEVIGATEHTTQTPPDFLREIIETVVKHGAKYFCIADTIGTARPVGVLRIIRFTKQILADIGANSVQVDWHGHDDLGNGLSNAMTAIKAGANRLHTVARGIGERAGNTRMESVLLNCTEILKEHNKPVPWNMTLLHEILGAYDTLTQHLPPSHGPLSKRAFRTSLGIHTAAMLKAQLLVRSAKRLKQDDLVLQLERMAGRIYSAIDPQSVGNKHEIHVGPWSGRSTVRLVYMQMGHNPDKITDALIASVLATAKALGRELHETELIGLFDSQ